MKYSTKLSDALHVLVLIADNPMEDLTSARIAESIHTNPGFIRQIMSALKKAGLITSVSGHAKPALLKEAKDITLYEVYKAIEGDKPLLHLDTHTNPACGIGVNIQHAVKSCYDAVQEAAEVQMQAITLADIIASYRNLSLG